MRDDYLHLNDVREILCTFSVSHLSFLNHINELLDEPFQTDNMQAFSKKDKNKFAHNLHAFHLWYQKDRILMQANNRIEIKTLLGTRWIMSKCINRNFVEWREEYIR